MLNNNLLPTKVKVKPVANNTFSEPLSSPILAVSEGTPQKALLGRNEPEHIEFYSYSSKYELSDKVTWNIRIAKNFDFNYVADYREGATSGYFKDKRMLMAKWGIPIGNDGVIIQFAMGPTGITRQYWNVDDMRPRSKVRSDPFYGKYGELGAKGVYVNMSPTEVRQRYFPEDIQ